MRRHRSLSAWLAYRSTATAIIAIVAGYVLQTTALPALSREAGGLETEPSAVSNWLTAASDWLVFLPVPGLVLGIGAIAIKPLRPVLAVLAAVASFAAVMLIAGALVGALMPMYEMPELTRLDPGRGPTGCVRR